MSGFDLIDHDLHVGTKPTVARGRVKIAPTSEDDQLVVVLRGFSSAYPETVPPRQWASRGISLPAEGDECVVLIDHAGDPWVAVWVGDTAFESDDDPALTEAAVLATGLVLEDIPATGDVSMGGHKLTDVDDGAATTDAATLGQTESLIASATGAVLTGHGPPGSGVGATGQLYLDLDNDHVWGPRGVGGWPTTATGRLVPVGALTWSQIQSG
jgi:hypothetical protein